CPSGYWGLTCTNACPPECDTNCHIENGQCNTICFGYSDPPLCQKECASGQWGINCSQRCSSGCYKSSCNRTSGICDQGCLGYSDPPKCRSKCSPGQWGINCSQTCSQGCLSSSCIASTGHCDKGCLGYSNPPLCNLTCSSGDWGVNCSQTCSKGCYNSSCNHTNGVCDQGCLGYNDPPKCQSRCSSGRWGLNCLTACPQGCWNSSCNASTGLCEKGCLGYSNPPFCNNTCSKGHWGLNCSLTCPKKCLHSSCLAASELCDQGCLGYSNPPVCSIACQEGVFGLNCTQNCSTNCMNGTCNHVTGFCHGCLQDYYGDFCQLFNSSLRHSSNSASVTESTIGAVLALLLIALCLGVIGFIRRKQVQKAVMDLNIVQRMTAKKSDLLTTEQNYLDEKDIADTNSEDSNDSCVSHSATPLTTTTISVKDLQTFVQSKPREYFARQFKLIPTAQNVTWDVGLSEENRSKNRYKDIVTYDHSRVVLIRNDEENEEDYINASYIKGFYADNRFIASQGPNKTMINDFVQMLWEQKTKKVVMLTNLVEDGKTKCERYWPEKGKSIFGQIKVSVISTQTFADYTIRTMQLTKGDETAHVLAQFHFTSWPDKNVPITPWSLVEFYHKVYLSPSSVPTVVHCSAGVGRTGTFIALCNIMDQAKETGKVDFFNTLSKLRQDRICMIQTVEQYVFLHKFARVALLCMGTFITESNISERVVDLNKRNNSMSKMEEEFSSLCEMCHCPDESESGNENMTEADQLYQNVKCATEQRKDRFPELAPKDCYRVHLSDINNDYIHAVYIQSYTSRDANILTQLPLPNTVVDFWKCVVEKKISLIVTFELDTSWNDKSVAQYLPEGVEQYFLCSPVKVQCLSFRTLKIGEERKLNVTWKYVHHKVTHIKTDHKDLDPRKLLTLINQIRSYDVQGRTMFVCKNGSTISGLACTLVTILDRLDQDKLVSVPLVVGSVKAIRPKVIDNMTEYRIVYEVLQSYIDTSSSYANVEVCNLPKFSMSRSNPVFTEDENQDENPYCNY
ncbi:receptor-type tyrosine-protein phosphatase T, partial [Biomphalaria pfeifferi]